MANEELRDGQISRIAPKISSKSLKIVVLNYKMGIEQTDLDNITTAADGNEQEVIRQLLIKWKNMTGATVQVLERFLAFLKKFSACTDGKCPLHTFLE